MFENIINFDIRLNWYFFIAITPRSTQNLDWFYGMSTIVAYLMPNPVYTYISNI